MIKNYYQILGLKNTATFEEIKKVYRELAQKFHPDKNPNNKDAEERFKAIAEANEILSNPTKRAAYDQQLLDEKLRQEQIRQQNERAARSRVFEKAFGQIIVLLLVVLTIGLVVNSSSQSKS